MKTRTTATIILILAFLTLSCADFSFFSKLSSFFGKKEDTSKPSSSSLSKHEQFSEFIESLFSYFHLSKPNEIIGCFGEVTSHIFLKSFEDKYSILKDTAERNSIRLHLDWVKFESLKLALSEPISCVFQTQEFSKLLDKLSVKDKSPESINLAFYIYYQANYPTLPEEFKPIVEDLKDKNFAEAGEKYASILSDGAKAMKKKGWNYLAYQAFSNGVSDTLSLNYPSDFIKCYNNETSGSVLGFLYELSKTVVDGSWREGDVNALKFWEEQGKSMLGKIPHSVWKCDLKSKDTKEMSEKLGVEFDSDEFYSQLEKYVKEHNIAFYSYMRTIKKSFDDHNFVHAGNTYGHLLESMISK